MPGHQARRSLPRRLAQGGFCALTSIRYPRLVPSADEVKDVLAAIGLHEDSDEDCNNALINHETGLDPVTVDEVLDFLSKSDQVEGILTLGGRNPSLDDVRCVLPDRPRLWGDDGRYRTDG